MKRKLSHQEKVGRKELEFWHYKIRAAKEEVYYNELKLERLCDEKKKET